MSHQPPRPSVQVGSRVIACARTGVCDVGELGLVYEAYDRGHDSQGYSIIFEGGRYDGFSPEELATMIVVTDEVEPTMIGYAFTNVITLCRDYEHGRFRFSSSRSSTP